MKLVSRDRRTDRPRRDARTITRTNARYHTLGGSVAAGWALVDRNIIIRVTEDKTAVQTHRVTSFLGPTLGSPWVYFKIVELLPFSSCDLRFGRDPRVPHFQESSLPKTTRLVQSTGAEEAIQANQYTTKYIEKAA